MRTKNAKRLWPVPATLAVMVLAALLAFGLMATTGAQPAEAQADSCDDGFAAAASGSTTCYTTDDTFDIKLLGSNTLTSRWVYSTGIGNAPPGALRIDGVTVTDVITTFADPVSLVQIEVDIPATDRMPGNSETVTIHRADAAKGNVYVFVSSAPSAPITDEDKELTTSDSSFEVTVTFLGVPEKDDGDAATPMGSTLEATPLGDNETSTIFTLTLKDGNSNVLTTENSAANALITVDDPTNKAMINGVRTNSRLINLGVDVAGDDLDGAPETGISQFTIDGLLKTGPVKTPVSVTITNARGMLMLTKDASRIGVAHTITSMTYWCNPANIRAVVEVINETPAVSELGPCQKEAEQLASKSESDDPSPRSVFAPGDDFIIVSKVVDELGQELKQNATMTDDAVNLEAEEMTADDEDDAGFMVSPEIGPFAAMDDPNDPADQDDVADQAAKVAYIMVTVPDEDDIDTGTYNFKVEDIPAKDAETTVSITVSGDPESYEITGDMWIPLGGEKTYTVTATDENGNIPAAVAADYMEDGDYAITVRVRGTEVKQDEDVVGLSSTGLLMVNAGKGTGTFTILAPVGAEQGDFATIRIIINEVVRDTLTVYFGEPDDGMMPTDGDMLTSPSGVDAASLPGTGTVSVSWTPGQNATQHWVVLFSLPGYDAEGRVEVLNDPDSNFQVLRNVPDGEYEVVVASYDPGMGFQYQDGIGMVTVE